MAGRGLLRALLPYCRPFMAALAFATISATSEAAWHRLDSPNFVVIGDASPRQLHEVAVKFEAFREVLSRLRGNEVATAAVPTVILVFRSEKAFAPFTPRYQGRATKIYGVFVPGRDVNHIAFYHDGSRQAPRVMYHEYAHLVIANSSGRIPVWLNEGLAEVYSTFELTRDGQEALIGRPIGEHLALLNAEPLLKLNDLLHVDRDSPLYNEGELRSVFYAQAWALVHMINFGEPSRLTQLRTYLQRVSEGIAPGDAWTQAFGADPIDRELDDYVSRATYRAAKHRLPEKLSNFEALAQPLAQAEVHAFLAHFLLAQQRLDDAREQLSTAMKLDARNLHVRVARAHSLLASGEHATALERLLELGEPGDWLAAYYAGVALAEAIERSQDTRAEPASAAGRLFDAASRERSFPNAVIRRAGLEAASGGVPADATILAVQAARSAAPAREDYAFRHAQLLALRSDFRAARSIVGPLLASSEPTVREAARSLMGWLVSLEQHRAAAAAAAATLQAAADSGSSTARASPRAAARHPVFRALKDGEERLEGVLHQIECSIGGAAVFSVRTAEQMVQLPARMSDVQFITYRDDLSGTVSCGPLKEPMRVYVTSRASSNSNTARDVVAVEFLPRQMP